MIANSACISCCLRKQTKKIELEKDESKKKAYIHEVLKILYENGTTHSMPYINYEVEKLYKKYFNESIDYKKIKCNYNQYMLDKESYIEEKVKNSKNPIKTAILYACAGNYIDFGTLNNVEDTKLEEILSKAEGQRISNEEVELFKNDLDKAKSLLYITDNCGEIVLDKILINLIKFKYPRINITLMVRGGTVLNDACIEDAEQIGITNIVNVIDNGCAIAGTPIDAISSQAKEYLNNADVIISKGQANFESLCEEGYNPYYMFLCKCSLFIKRFGLKQYSWVFGKESRLERKF